MARYQVTNGCVREHVGILLETTKVESRQSRIRVSVVRTTPSPETCLCRISYMTFENELSHLNGRCLIGESF